MPALILTVLLLAGRAAAQCCGDCDGDGRTTIDELVAAVGAALRECPSAPTETLTPRATSTVRPPRPSATPMPSATPTPGTACPFDFSNYDDNFACAYRGAWSQGGACGFMQLTSSWYVDGDMAIGLTIDPEITFAAEIVSATQAVLFAYWTLPDASDVEPISGTMEVAGIFPLVIDPVGTPFTIGGCGFTLYRGAFVELLDLREGGGGTSARAFRKAREFRARRPRLDLRRH